VFARGATAAERYTRHDRALAALKSLCARAPLALQAARAKGRANKHRHRNLI
jgi:hypothetical protein